MGWAFSFPPVSFLFKFSKVKFSGLGGCRIFFFKSKSKQIKTSEHLVERVLIPVHIQVLFSHIDAHV